MKALLALPLIALACAGCSSVGQLTPSAALAVSNAYTAVCANLPAVGPISSTLNAKAQAAYAQAQMICSNGAPTNAVVAGIDILAIESALLPYFKK